MAFAAGRLLRDHAFVVAAAALPLLVVGVFLLSTIVPRSTVSPPAYDALLRTHSYDPPVGVAVDFTVQDGRVHMMVQPVPTGAYPGRAHLWRFDHTTMTLREVTVELPEALGSHEALRTVPVAALADRRVVAQPVAPDGYQLRDHTDGSPGIIGELFGMRRSGSRAALVKDGRVIPLEFPSPIRYASPTLLAWVIE